MKTIDYDEIVPQLGYFINRHCTPGWVINNAVIEFVDLTYVIEGSAIYIIDGISYKVTKGDLICIPKNSRRYAISNPNDPMTNYAANFQIFSLAGDAVSLPFPVVSKIGLRSDLLSLYRELNHAWLHKDPGYTLKVRAIFLQILHYYFSLLYYKSSYATFDPRIQKATRFIMENFSAPIEVSELASLAGLNPVYFGILFKKYTGYTIKEYINLIRINNAENILATGEFTVNEAALRCGFKEPFYFSKIFKSIKGYSPSKVKYARIIN